MKKTNHRLFLIINVVLICLLVQNSGLYLHATGNTESQSCNQLNDLEDEESNNYNSFKNERYNLRNKKHRSQSFLKKQYSHDSQKKFTRKQALCIFFCVLIIGGAILVPMITPFFYLFAPAHDQSDAPASYAESIFDETVAQVNYLNPIPDLDTQNNIYISDAVCRRSGDADMCCSVIDNALLRCCDRELCHEISFSGSPQNSYLIHERELYLIKPNQQMEKNVNKDESFKLYKSLIKLSEYHNRGFMGQIARQEVENMMESLVSIIKEKMPGLKMREIALGYFTEDGSLVRITKNMPGKEGIIRRSLRNTVGELFAASYSRRIISNECRIGSDCALAVIGIDYSKLAKVRLSDDDIERILAHELGHLIQRKQILLEDYSHSNFAQYIRDNIEIDADAKSQLAVDSNGLNFDMAEVLIKIDRLLSNSFGESFRIDSSFNCSELMNQAGENRFALHPDNRCRVAFVLSLSEAMQKMNYFFKQRI